MQTVGELTEIASERRSTKQRLLNSLSASQRSVLQLLILSLHLLLLPVLPPALPPASPLWLLQLLALPLPLPPPLPPFLPPLHLHLIISIVTPWHWLLPCLSSPTGAAC